MNPNKYRLFLAGFFIFFSIICGTLFKKYFLVFFHQSVYYCQQIISSLPIRLPVDVGEAGILVLMGLLTYLVLKVGASVIKTRRLKNRLQVFLTGANKINSVISKLDLDNKTLVFQNEYPSAFCLGFRNPKIYVSSGLIKILSVVELEAVLRHEKYHLENKDGLAYWFAAITQTVFPFFPVMTDIVKNYRVENEVAADRAAVNGMKTAAPLASVLSKLIAFEPRNVLAPVPAIADCDTLEIRVRRLVKQKITKSKIPLANILISLSSLTVLGWLMLSPISAFEYHSPDTDAVFLCKQDQEVLFSHI